VLDLAYSVTYILSCRILTVLSCSTLPPELIIIRVVGRCYQNQLLYLLNGELSGGKRKFKIIKPLANSSDKISLRDLHDSVFVFTGDKCINDNLT